MSVVPTHFSGLPMTEVVPDSASIRGVSKSSVLSGRRRIRFQPQTGVTASPGSIVQFVLADSTCLLDTASAVLSYTVTTTGTGAVAMDDGPSEWRRFQSTFNGSLVDDIDNVARNTNALVYASADKAWLTGAGSFAGYWKDSVALASSGSAYVSSIAGSTAVGNQMVNGSTIVNTNTSAVEGDALRAQQNASVRYKAGMSKAIPLGLLSGVFRTKQYLPLSQMGELVLQLTCAVAGEAIWQANGATDGSYTITDIFLECDLVTPHYMYAQMLNALCQDENEPGLVIPVETAIVSQGQSVSSGSQDSAIIVSRATNNLRKIVVTACPTSALQGINFPSVSCFGHNNFVQVQWRIGSLYFPSQPANSDARAFWMTQSSFNNAEPLNVYNGSLNYNTYKINTTSAGVLNEGSAFNAGQQLYDDKFILAYNFDNFRGGEELDADGASILGQSGSQIVTQLRNAPAEGITPTVSLLATKYLHLKSGALRIVGA